ncbi:MAG: c-type cytochrome [Magnetococcales bacterium]|nr:c-type cytochrome [Magnetococcales bacterium]
MKKSLIFTPLLLAMLSLAIPVDSTFAADESQWTGKKLFMRKTCMACHGKEGKKAILNYPFLAGQDRIYLKNQMIDIASGKRSASLDPTGHPRTDGMKGIMHLVDNSQIKKIADWLAELPPAPLYKDTESLDAARVASGEDLYTKFNCKNCHGVAGNKPLKSMPVLAGQKREYLALQMIDMQSGVRKNGKSGMMKSFIKKVSEEEVHLIAEYLSQVERLEK